jgi:hypothetical protein
MAHRTFAATKKLNLSAVGKDWDDAYIEVAVPTLIELREVEEFRAEPDTLRAANMMLEYLKKHFLAGKAPLDGNLVDLTVDDLAYMPTTAMGIMMDHVSGRLVLDPN